LPIPQNYELFYGARKSRHSKATLQIIQNFLIPFEIIPFGKNETDVYGIIRYDLEKQGKMIGPNDLIIAATALANGARLITHNEKEFKRVKALKVENWVN